ncbi:MAG: hypothetical protein ACT6FD_05270 [Methanosarcinaceae archaeon]
MKGVPVLWTSAAMWVGWCGRSFGREFMWGWGEEMCMEVIG